MTQAVIEVDSPVCDPAPEQVEGARTPLLSEILFDAPHRNFGSLAALPSNVQAIDAALLFSAGMQPFVALVGPSGWGKTHLLEAVSTRLALQEDVEPQVLSASEWALGVSKMDPAQPLLLDNAQEALDQSRLRQAVRLGLERRVKGGRPTFMCFTASKPNRLIRGLLPQPRSWSVAAIGVPEPTERMLVIEQMARVEGLALGHQIIRIIASNMHGNGRTLIGALKRLKLQGTKWNETMSQLRACGILNPFLVDGGDWDLGDTIARAASKSAPNGTGKKIALYLMLRQATLAEADVARYFGIEPREAYQRAAEVERDATSEPALRQAILATATAAIEELCSL